VDPHPEPFTGRTNGFVDFSENVIAKDLRAAVADGFDPPELAKCFTTATMGPLQGKLEAVKHGRHRTDLGLPNGTCCDDVCFTGTRARA